MTGFWLFSNEFEVHFFGAYTMPHSLQNHTQQELHSL